MNLTFAIYLVSVADNLQTLGTLALVMAGAVVVVEFVMMLYNFDRYSGGDSETGKKILKHWLVPTVLIILFILAPFRVLTPSSKAVAAMVVIPAVAESGVLQKSFEGLESLVDDWVSELSSSKISTDKVKQEVRDAIEKEVKKVIKEKG